MVEQTSASADLLVSVRGLVKHYGEIKAVDGISFEVRRGDVLGFLGPNGAGKTTAMKMITGFLEPDEGTATVAGFDVREQGLESRRRVGYLPENAPAYGEMTVDGFLGFVAEARELPDRPKAVDRAIGRTGLESVRHQTIDTLSKGFKRRVGLAQALIHDPEVLILDEPTDGLDPNQKAVVHRLIGELASEKAIILSTHILDEVEQVCNRALIISRGRILEDSTPEVLMTRAPGHNTIRLKLAAHVGEEGREALKTRLEGQAWSASVHADGNMLEVAPADGGNHLQEVLALVPNEDLAGIEVVEGRLTDLFRDVTEGVAA